MRTFGEAASRVSRETGPYEEHALLTPAAPAERSIEAPALTRRAFIAAAACVAAGALAGCGGPAEDAAAPVAQDDPCPYNWNDLIWDGGRPVYRVNDQILSKWGVDVSEHQLEVEWGPVAEAGAMFAFVRIGNRGATKGTLDVDDYFMQNVTGAHKAGIPVHAYFFSQSVTEEEAREEAAFALAQVHKAEAEGVSFGIIAYDHEEVELDGARANNLDSDQFAANARAFCEVIQQSGYEAMIYGNQRDLLRLTPAERKDYPLWLAEYGIDEPTAEFNFAIWQYTNQGTVPGIPTNADLNIWFETAQPDQAA